MQLLNFPLMNIYRTTVDLYFGPTEYQTVDFTDSEWAFITDKIIEYLQTNELKQDVPLSNYTITNLRVSKNIKTPAECPVELLISNKKNPQEQYRITVFVEVDDKQGVRVTKINHTSIEYNDPNS